MGKKLVLVLLAAVFLFTTFGLAFAEEKGNPRKGKFLFRKSCRDCHKEGAEGKELSPSSKTMDQWKAAFAKEKIDTYKCKEEFAKLNEKDVNDIYTYLHKYAADSPSPAKCK